MEIKESQTPTKQLLNDLTETILSHEGKTLCICSGGSALALINGIKNVDVKGRTTEGTTFSLTQAEAFERVKGRTIFMMGDERAGEVSEENNYNQLAQTLGDDAKAFTLINTQYSKNSLQRDS